MVPSITARVMAAALKLARFSPKKTPLASGRTGTRSPSMNGRKSSPSAPAGRPPARSLQAGVVDVQHGLPHLGRVGHVHGAEQGQPAARAVAECRDFALGIGEGLVEIGIDRARGAQADRADAGRDVARADGPHHVVAAAGGNQDVLEAEGRRDVRLHRTGRFEGMVGGRGASRPGRRRRRPGPRDASAGSRMSIRPVPEASPYSMTGLSGQVEIDVVVGQEDRGQAGEALRLVPLEPEDFRGREADGGSEAQFFDGRLRSAQGFDQGVVLGHGRRVVPQLGRAERAAVRVERHEAVLLARNAQGADFGRIDSGFAEGVDEGLFEGGRSRRPDPARFRRASSPGIMACGAWPRPGDPARVSKSTIRTLVLCVPLSTPMAIHGDLFPGQIPAGLEGFPVGLEIDRPAELDFLIELEKSSVRLSLDRAARPRCGS